MSIVERSSKWFPFAEWHKEKFGTWHRCTMREVMYDYDAWIVQEGPLAVMVQFICSSDRIDFNRGMWARGYRTLPMSELRLWVCLPYVPGRICCDTWALYKEK